VFLPNEVSGLGPSGLGKLLFGGVFLGLRFAPTQAITFWAFSPLKFGLREHFFVAFCEKSDPETGHNY
jgi:hypothetical protein